MSFPPRSCACGCEELTNPSRRFIKGHDKRRRHPELPSAGDIIGDCACGCGGNIVYKPYYYYYGIPKYLVGHRRKGRTKETDVLIAKHSEYMKIHSPTYNPEVAKKVADSQRGVPRPCMVGEKNPAKRLEVRKKISEYAKQRDRWDMLGSQNSAWLGGISFEPYSFEFNRARKGMVKSRDDFACRLCGIDKKLLIHHIDYDKKNFSLENLITLCLSCNSKVNGNRAHWVRYFRDLLFIDFVEILLGA